MDQYCYIPLIPTNFCLHIKALRSDTGSEGMVHRSQKAALPGEPSKMLILIGSKETVVTWQSPYLDLDMAVIVLYAEETRHREATLVLSEVSEKMCLGVSVLSRFITFWAVTLLGSS